MARDLAANGAAAVVVHYNSDATRAAAEETLQAVKAAGAEAIAVQGDLTQPANVALLFEEAVKAFGKVDIAINTAGLVIKNRLPK